MNGIPDTEQVSLMIRDRNSMTDNHAAPAPQPPAVQQLEQVTTLAIAPCFPFSIDQQLRGAGGLVGIGLTMIWDSKYMLSKFVGIGVAVGGCYLGARVAKLSSENIRPPESRSGAIAKSVAICGLSSVAAIIMMRLCAAYSAVSPETVGQTV